MYITVCYYNKFLHNCRFTNGSSTLDWSTICLPTWHTYTYLPHILDFIAANYPEILLINTIKTYFVDQSGTDELLVDHSPGTQYM